MIEIIEMIKALRSYIEQLDQVVDAGPGLPAYMPMPGNIGKVWIPEGAAAARSEAANLREVVGNLLALA